MWWRNPIRVAAVIALGALNAACFQPLYASRSVAGGAPLGTQLAQVEVEHVDAPNGTPESRVAVELQNALDFEMNGGGGLISPTHRLKVRMSLGRNSIITDVTTGRVGWASLGHVAYLAAMAAVGLWIAGRRMGRLLCK